jgi:hypothetical protein
MELINPLYTQIKPIPGYTSLERATAISEELYNITRPKTIRFPDEIQGMLLPVVDYEGTGRIYLSIKLDHIVYVHPESSLDKLISLFPDLSIEEKNNLKTFIKNTSLFYVRNIIPQDTELLASMI